MYMYDPNVATLSHSNFPYCFNIKNGCWNVCSTMSHLACLAFSFQITFFLFLRPNYNLYLKQAQDNYRDSILQDFWNL